MDYLKKILRVMGNDLFTSCPVFTLFAQRIFRVTALGKFGHWRLRNYSLADSGIKMEDYESFRTTNVICNI